ncbi:MAG: hypothetical protein AB1847_13185 [bacterium]
MVNTSISLTRLTIMVRNVSKAKKGGNRARFAGAAGETFLLFAAMIFLTAQVCSAEVNPYSFPDGPRGLHYNLNIISKKAGFICPKLTYEENGNSIGDNAVFVPDDGIGFRISMQYEKGEGAEGERTAEVTGGRRVSYPYAGIDGNDVLIQLPMNEAGYRVYAKALTKPADNPDVTVIPALMAVKDESGNDLVYLGLITESGVETSYESSSIVCQKDKSRAVDITALFRWSGTVCYLYEPEEYQNKRDLCCVDLDFDGVYDEWYDAVEDPLTNLPPCSEGYSFVTAYCKEYADEWVFNITDFAPYLWRTDKNGMKSLQVRFYPN